jgi:hypothetical protein
MNERKPVFPIIHRPYYSCWSPDLMQLNHNEERWNELL